MDVLIKMDVLIECEESQEVCKAFREAGHQAFSCDLQDCSGGRPEWHIKGDAIDALRSRKWGLVIAHPPCTRLANSGVRWLSSMKNRGGYSWNEQAQRYLRNDPKIWRDLQDAVQFFNVFKQYGQQGGRIAIEQPVHHRYASNLINEPHTQTIEPYQFGHKQKKKTLLWLYGLPLLKETNNVYNEMMKLPYKERAAIHYESPGPERAKNRSKTFSGIAAAMAAQWGTI